MSINRVILFGTVDRDPEIRTAPYNPDERLVRFSLLTTKTWRKKDGACETKKTRHRLLIKRENLVSLIEKYTKKGSRLTVYGKLRTRTNEQTSQRYTEVLVNEITLCPSNLSAAQSDNVEVVDDSLNIIVLGGYVGGEPKINQGFSNPELQIARFSIATNEVWTVDGARREHTTWHDVYTMRDKLRMQVEQYVKKGAYCVVVGELTNRKLVTEESTEEAGENEGGGTSKGGAKYITEINLQRLIPLSRSTDTERQGNVFGHHSISDDSGDVDFADDNIPFDDFLDESSGK